MKYYYPQACAVLTVVFENFGSKTAVGTGQAYRIDAQCKRVVVSINNYTEADTFELELDYKVFPFDPRTIRSCQVSIHMENSGRLPEGGELSVIKPSDDNVIFMGFADEDEMTFDESARRVKLKGRDFTGLFSDARWPGKLLAVDKPVDTVVETIVSQLKAAGDIEVENRTNEFVLPILATYAPDFGELAGKRNAKKRETYWDVIQELVARAGLIAYIELDKLVLSKPRTLFSETKSVKFVYGKNVKDLELKRNMGRQKGFNVVVRCVVDKEVLKAEIPKDSTSLPEGGDHVYIPKQTAKGVVIDKGEDAVAPAMSFAVTGIKSKEQLIKIGEAIYEEISRQQLEGRFKTYDMCASGGEDMIPEEFDLLKLRNGTAVKILLDVFDLENITKNVSAGQRATYLAARGFDPQIATLFADTHGKFSDVFYTRSVTFTLDANSGFSADIDFVNWISDKKAGLGL